MKYRKTAAILMAAALIAPAPALACKNKFKKEKPKISQIEKAKLSEKVKPKEKIISDTWVNEKTSEEYMCLILDGNIRVVGKDNDFFKDYEVKEDNLNDAQAIFCNGDSIITVTKDEVLFFYGIDKLTHITELDREYLWVKCFKDILELDVVAVYSDDKVLAILEKDSVSFSFISGIGKNFSTTATPSTCEYIPEQKFQVKVPENTKAEDVFFSTFKNNVFLTFKDSNTVYRFELKEQKVESVNKFSCSFEFENQPEIKEKGGNILMIDGSKGCSIPE